MRDWSLAAGDPLELSLAADFRLGSPDYLNDHVWELEPGGGDPPALALHTTYGLRARGMRLFPRFHLDGAAVSDPGAFPVPPRLRRFFPNFLLLEFSPLEEIEVGAEYWLPDSHTAAGRLTVANHRDHPVSLLLELCGQLVPLEGQPLAAVSHQAVNILSGHTGDLEPVLFITGGPHPGPGPYASLVLDLALASGGTRTLTWAQAALASREASFEHARRTAARPWEAERSRLEMVNAAQTVEVQTGDPDWDAAFALSQKAAFHLFFGPSEKLPFPSFVQARQADHGYSPHQDGSDYSHLWSGQTPLDSYYLASNLPGAPELAKGLVRNFLSVQAEDGGVDWKPGLAGQRGRWLAAPLLASLAWQAYRRSQDREFLLEVQTELGAFSRAWLTEAHDRDRDGFPEWDHPFQTSLENRPDFSLWQAGGQGLDITLVEDPALAAMLCREFHTQSHIAAALDQPSVSEILELESGKLRSLVEECWDSQAVLYRIRDRDSHLSPKGKPVGSQRGDGLLYPKLVFRQPMRLLIQVRFQGESLHRPEVLLQGRNETGEVEETLERPDFQWGHGLAAAATRRLYSELKSVRVTGLEKHDQVSIRVANYSGEAISCFLPLWAEIPNLRRAQNLVNRSLLAAERFGRPFGIPACPGAPDPQTENDCQAVHLPWNLLIGEGLLAYDLREQAAQLTARLMSAVIASLKKQRAFAQAYHAESGAGLGERNALQGLAPLGLFLDVLGVEIQSPGRVALHGKNPFPWPVVVKYRGLTVTRQTEQTRIVFPQGQIVLLDDPSETVVTAG